MSAALVAAFVLLCQATAWVHVAATPHVTCAEHGESVHLTTATAPDDAGGPARASAPTEAADHAHEHCNLQGQRPTSAPTPETTFVRSAALTPPALVVGPPPPAVRLLLLAPKTSPPRAPIV